MTITIILSKINNFWLTSKSSSAYFINLVIPLVLFFLIKNTFVFYFTFLVLIIPFIYRLIHRHKDINSFTYFSINGKNQIDQELRGSQLSDLVVITSNLLMFTLGFLNFKNSIIDSFSWVILYIFIFAIIASISIKKNYILLKMLCIILSTGQGLIFVMFSLILILTPFSGNTAPSIEVIIDNFLYLCYILESEPIITIISIFTSVLLYFLFIFYTPAYQLEQLKDSFKYVSIIIAMCSIFIYFAGSPFVNNLSSIHSNEITNLITIDPGFESYYNNLSNRNISTIIYLLFLPYTFSILAANLFLDVKISKNKKKASKLFDSIFNQFNTPKEKELCIKKYFYYGGENSKYNTRKKLSDLENKFSDLEKRFSTFEKNEN